MGDMLTTIDDVTPEWLHARLAGHFPDVVVDSMSFGDRTDGTATRLQLHVRYAPGRDYGLPNQFYLKALLGPPPADITSLYACEVEFFRTMYPDLTIETPRLFGCDFDPDSGHFYLLMEDITARDARFGWATRPCSVAETAAVLESAAELHAKYWQSPRLGREFSWLETPLKGRTADFFRTDCPAIMLREYEISPYKAAIFDPSDYYTPERLWKALWTLQEINEADVPTVLHGDIHVGNTYFLPSGAGGILDWQMMRIGCWAHDVTYMIVTALTPEDRRAHEEELIRGYMDALQRRGISPPDWEQAWERHRQNVVWGILMWLATPTPLYDVPRLEAYLQRHRAAAEDLDSLAALGCA